LEEQRRQQLLAAKVKEERKEIPKGQAAAEERKPKPQAVKGKPEEAERKRGTTPEFLSYVPRVRVFPILKLLNRDFLEVLNFSPIAEQRFLNVVRYRARVQKLSVCRNSESQRSRMHYEYLSVMKLFHFRVRVSSNDQSSAISFHCLLLVAQNLCHWNNTCDKYNLQSNG
jgi:hypothetical protein